MSREVRVSYRDIGNWDLNTSKTLKDDGGSTADTQTIMMATLCVIRDELKVISRKLNALECGNFLDVPRKLDRIEKNTRKRKRPKVVVGKPKLRIVR